MYCEECEALSETCCAASKARRATAISLGQLVARQAEAIAALTKERDSARLDVARLMQLHRVAGS